MPTLTEVVREIDRIIQALVDLKSSLAVKDKKLKPSSPAEAKTRENADRCTVCNKELDVIDGKVKRIRGACPACHKKVNRLIISEEMTDEDAVKRGWFLPANKGPATCLGKRENVNPRRKVKYILRVNLYLN
jgi:phage FluMu protein Com